MLYHHCFRLCHQEGGKTEGLELNVTHQILICADDVNLVGEDVNIMKKNTKAILNCCEEIGIEETQRKLYICYVLSPDYGTKSLYRVIQKEVYTFKNLFYKNY
jgi:hypothetical protein